MSHDLAKGVVGAVVFIAAGLVMLGGANPLVAALEGVGESDQPTDVTTVTTTSTAPPTPTPTVTPTSTPSSSTPSEQFSSPPLTVIVEVENNGTQIMVGLQNVPPNVASAEVEGAVIREPLDVDDDYPMARGTIARPATVTVIATYNNGTREIVTQRQIPAN